MKIRKIALPADWMRKTGRREPIAFRLKVSPARYVNLYMRACRRDLATSRARYIAFGVRLLNPAPSDTRVPAKLHAPWREADSHLLTGAASGIMK